MPRLTGSSSIKVKRLMAIDLITCATKQLAATVAENIIVFAFGHACVASVRSGAQRIREVISLGVETTGRRLVVHVLQTRDNRLTPGRTRT